jgi:hypothetical protein
MPFRRARCLCPSGQTPYRVLEEWRHFTLEAEPVPEIYFDFPVIAPAN